MGHPQENALDAIKSLARPLSPEKGRALTGLIGELSTCILLNLNWDPSDGYDAVDGDGKRVQIKTRRDSKGGMVNEVGTVGKFLNYNFDYALYAELDANFEVTAIYLLEKKTVLQLVRPKRNDATVHKFRKHGEIVFPKQSFVR